MNEQHYVKELVSVFVTNADVNVSPSTAMLRILQVGAPQDVRHVQNPSALHIGKCKC